MEAPSRAVAWEKAWLKRGRGGERGRLEWFDFPAGWPACLSGDRGTREDEKQLFAVEGALGVARPRYL